MGTVEFGTILHYDYCLIKIIYYVADYLYLDLFNKAF